MPAEPRHRAGWWRKPNEGEAAFLALVLLWCGVIVLDLVEALGGHPCSDALRPSSRCYPWGGDGPLAGMWEYRSRSNYLISSSYLLACSVLVLFAPLVTASWRRTIVRVGAIVALYIVGDRILGMLL